MSGYCLTLMPSDNARHGVDMFYVGHQGQFDAYVYSELKKLKQEYPQINYAVVLAYMPGKKTEYDDYSDTMLPEGIESVHPRYAISWRNNWMEEIETRQKQYEYYVDKLLSFEEVKGNG